MHCHVQIQYRDKQNECVESLDGFNPMDLGDREHVHNLLDEYLNQLAKKFDIYKDMKEVEFKDDFFKVHGYMDS